MSSVFGKIRCPICSMKIKRQDRVVLDVIHTVMHQECYNQEYMVGKSLLPIKDAGSFRKIMYIYEFFREGPQT
ncbi:hypothetical protein [Anoxybacteroides tepidamans]|uniref:hypothetical protein n=1 Tax=Anoxybacteroides tepidamans TaxID=265948 RepID=UPI000A031384|nr:hypothetical protein [Anoxybacillus tepidamans]